MHPPHSSPPDMVTRPTGIAVACFACGMVWELPDCAQLLQARARGTPILPARCRYCRRPFSPASLDYLRELLLAHCAQPLARRHGTVVRLLPRA